MAKSLIFDNAPRLIRNVVKLRPFIALFTTNLYFRAAGFVRLQEQDLLALEVLPFIHKVVLMPQRGKMLVATMFHPVI